MADRVHPAPPPPPPPLSSSPPHQHQQHPHDQHASAAAMPPPPTETTPLQHQQQQPHPSFARPPAPTPGTYIVQVPKDQVLRVPPPDRARRYKKLSSRPARRRALRRACCCACLAVLLLLALAAAFAGAVYLAYRPRAPAFTVASLSIRGLDAASLALATSSTGLTPRLAATVRADNTRNGKVGVEYRAGGRVAVSYDAGAARLASGPWPAFRQPPRNVTAFVVAMTGQGVRLTEAQAARIVKEQAAGAVPLLVEVTVPVRLRFGAVLRTWTVRVRARCDVAVDRLDGDSIVAVNRGCRIKVRPLWWWW